MIEIDHSLFATRQRYLPRAQSANHGHDTVITDAAHDTITLKGVTIAQLTGASERFSYRLTLGRTGDLSRRKPAPAPG